MVDGGDRMRADRGDMISRKMKEMCKIYHYKKVVPKKVKKKKNSEGRGKISQEETFIFVSANQSQNDS